MERFEQHVFISYAHIDNQPLTPGEQGWVTRFHGTLGALLGMRLGGAARIWRDDKLAGNDVFDPEIVSQFAHTAVFVAVLTPRYLKSEWCTRELREFCEAADRTGGAVVDNKSRVFKVIKTPVTDQQSLPDAVKEALGYEFFEVQSDSTPLELDPAYGDEYAQAFAQHVARLAWQVAQLVADLEVAGPAVAGPAVAGPETHIDAVTAPSAAPGKSTVFLAECSSDRRADREMLEGELRRLGHAVLPDQRLPADEADYLAAVAGLLERSALAIHLIGERYGLVPDGTTTKSVVVHQNELAASRSRGSGLPRLIWLPDGTRSDQAPQQAFIDSLHADADAQFGADLITGDLEALRTIIHATLDKIERKHSDAAPEPRADGEHSRRVYLVCDKEDRKATVPIRKFCEGVGIDVELPAFEGDAARVRQANRELMEGCDAVLLFYGAGDDAWKRTIDSDLKKMAGYMTGGQMPPVHTYLAHPRTPDKDDLVDMEEANLIVGFDGFDETSMSDFVRAAGATSDTR